MSVVAVIILVFAVLSILFFALYLVGLSRTPSGHRPRTDTFDRFGRRLPPSTNPGYRETERERHR